MFFFTKDRATIKTKFQQIASTALSMDHGDYLDMVVKKPMKLTQHDCYKSVTQRVQAKCFDLPVSSSKKKQQISNIIFLE